MREIMIEVMISEKGAKKALSEGSALCVSERETEMSGFVAKLGKVGSLAHEIDDDVEQVRAA